MFIESQRILKTSPDGQLFGYMKDGALRVRRRDGSEAARIDGVAHRPRQDTDWRYNDWRFSPDGKRVAAILGGERPPDDTSYRNWESPEYTVVSVDLDTGDQRKLGKVRGAERVEWTAKGVVVMTATINDKRQLAYFPLDEADGKQRMLIKRQFDIAPYFVTASEGTQLFYARWYEEGFSRLYRLDVAAEAEPELIGTVDAKVRNADGTRDGKLIAFATYKGLFLVEGDQVKQVATDKGINAVWFSGDGGRLLYASNKEAVVIDGDETWRLEAKASGWDGDKVSSVRFVPGSGDVLVTTAQKVLRWDPEKGSHDPLARARRKKHGLVVADLFGDDVVVWGYEPRPERSDR
jgi:dipeptidyl aminopeptidase/acylaminoacyl peptidase